VLCSTPARAQDNPPSLLPQLSNKRHTPLKKITTKKQQTKKGLDTCLSIMKVLHTGLGDTKYRPCPLLQQYVDAGWIGQKVRASFAALWGVMCVCCVVCVCARVFVLLGVLLAATLTLNPPLSLKSPIPK
jgi:hypothetical protein